MAQAGEISCCAEGLGARAFVRPKLSWRTRREHFLCGCFALHWGPYSCRFASGQSTVTRPCQVERSARRLNGRPLRYSLLEKAGAGLQLLSPLRSSQHVSDIADLPSAASWRSDAAGVQG